jgi:hypothetical protein
MGWGRSVPGRGERHGLAPTLSRSLCGAIECLLLVAIFVLCGLVYAHLLL